MGTTALKQPQIERKWFIYNEKKHKEVYLYYITSTYLEGTENELAAFGYNRDGNQNLPFLKSWNKKAKSKLSFADVMEELKDIKLVELNLGRNVDTLKITELNELQKEILKLFGNE